MGQGRCRSLDAEERCARLVAHLGLAHKTAAIGRAGDRGEGCDSAPLGPAVAARSRGLGVFGRPLVSFATPCTLTPTSERSLL